MADVTTCSGCGATIRWVLTIGGARLPLDPDPHPDGNVVPVEVDGKRRAKVLTGPEMPAQETAWRAHFTTCPKSAHFRRRKAAATPKCRYCETPLDAWLVEQGENRHVNCGPVLLREAVQTSPAGSSGEAGPVGDTLDLGGGEW